jgi:hypothetical protein
MALFLTKINMASNQKKKLSRKERRLLVKGYEEGAEEDLATIKTLKPRKMNSMRSVTSRSTFSGQLQTRGYGRKRKSCC